MRTKASRKRHAFVRSVRAEGAIAAYERCLGWLTSGADVDTVLALLKDKIFHCYSELSDAKRNVIKLNGGADEAGKITPGMIEFLENRLEVKR